MFKLFKSAKTKPTEPFIETVQQARRLTEVQISACEGKASHKKIFDVYACAYIFGFADAMLTQAGVEDLDGSEARAWLASGGNDRPMGLTEYLNAP